MGRGIQRSRHFRRGIYLMPTLFTVGNLFCGFSSVVQSSLGNFEIAGALIVVAAVLDGLDGRIARMTGTTSSFGLEFDSLSDIVSFGIAPAILAYHWALQPGRVGWLVAFLYVVCAAMRLARFNIQSAPTDKRFFVGLPSPMAGVALASIAFAFPDPLGSRWLGGLLLGLVVLLAMLMISRLRYRSFREIDLGNRRSYIYVLPIAATLVAVALHPQTVLLVLFLTYLMSAPILWVWNRGTGRVAHPAAGDPAPVEVADEPAIR